MTAHEHLRQQKSGITQVTVGYLVWGLLPMFWKTLDHVGPFEVLLHRIFWCALWSSVYFVLRGRRPWLVLRCAWRRSSPLLLVTSAVVVAVNWLSYIYAVTSGHLLQASLGYFICPILIVLLGVLLFKERMTPLQILALLFCIAGVVYATLRADGFPWLSVLIGGTFALYGTMKKIIGVDGVTALLSDTVLLTPAVLAAMGYLYVGGAGEFLTGSTSTNLLLSAAGLATLVPLMLFIQGTITIPYKTVGFLQFITPTMAFILGVWVYREPFSFHQGITFLLILLGVLSYILYLIKRPRRGVPLA